MIYQIRIIKMKDLKKSIFFRLEGEE